MTPTETAKDAVLLEVMSPGGRRWTLRLIRQLDGREDDLEIICHAKQEPSSFPELAEVSALASAESAPSSTSKSPEHLHLKPWTHPEGDAKPPSELLQTLGGRILAIHQELQRCKQLGMQLPTWSDLDSLLHPADSD